MNTLAKIFPPKWHALRGLGQSRIVSLTIIAPFLRYLIIFNQNIIAYFELSAGAIGTRSGASNMVEENFSRLRQIYLGLTTLGVASILFKSFCPPEILNYKDEHDFIQAELNVVTGRRYFTYQSRLRDLLSHLVEPMRARAAEVI